MTQPREKTVAELKEIGLIAVVRARSAGQVLPLAEALISGGMKAIEITFTTPDAPKAIREVHSHFGESAVVGAGTILKEEQLEQAIDAGARFAVSPILRPDLVKPSHVAGCPIMLGAYTPTEAQRAFEAGSDMVKIFPADTLGPAFIKALRAPLPHLPIVPTGGVNLDTMEAFLKAGCHALGVGSSLISSAILQNDDWPQLEQRAKAFTEKLADLRETV